MKTYLALTLLAGLAFAETKNPPWHEAMRNMSTQITELIPDLNRPEVFITEAERARVIEKSKKLLKLVHSIKETSYPANYDSLVPMISSDLKQEIENSIQLMESGKWSKGSHQMMDITRHCIACHTLKQGPSSPPPFDANFGSLSPIQRANYFAATRQFDKAIMNFESLLADTKWAQNHEEEWNDAFLKLIAITVRVKNNPSLTLELISRFFDSNTYPKKLKPTAKLWRQQVKSWRNSSQVHNASLEELRKILENAEKAQEKSSEPVSFIEFLRASGLLHGFLSVPTNANNQEALFLAGRASEGLKDQNFWTYAEHYYFRCMSIDAKSSVGKECNNRLAKLWGNLKGD